MDVFDQLRVFVVEHREVFTQLTVTGLSNGMVYALVAMGFVIIYKASDVINFAQGEFLLFGAYVCFTFIGQFGLPWSFGALLTLGSAVLLGLLVERLVLRPLIGEPIISMIMVTIGLSSLLKALVHAIWGPMPRSFPPFIPSRPVSLGPATVSADRLITIAIALLLLAACGLFFRYTRDGIAMRAIADDQQAALSMGISIKRVLAVAWAMAAVSAAVGGIMLANIVGASHDISYVGLRVFPVVILGGLDSIPGAIIGGAIIGLLEAYTGGYIGHGLSLVVPFLVLILVLMVRPYGLFGKPIIERV
jgi:branched-chain amino acid transport system permease protein